eukprot:2524030-Rhodomonas_salina.3
MEAAMQIVNGITAMVPDDPESNAVWLIRFTSIQFVSSPCIPSRVLGACVRSVADLNGVI